MKTATPVIPTENLVGYTYDAAWTPEGSITLEMTAARTSKGNDTHIARMGVDETAHRSLLTFCGLMAGQRVHHTVWSVAPTTITCEKCNGTTGKKSTREFWAKLSAHIANAR